MVNYRAFGVGKETTFGTPVSITDWINIIKEGISSDRRMNFPETAGYIEPRTQSVGKYKVGGPIDMLCVPDEIGWFLHSLFGQVSSAQQGATVAYKHTYKPIDTLIPYTGSIQRDAYALKLTSMACVKASLKLLPGEDIMNTFDVIAQKDEIGTPAAPTFTTYPQPLHAYGWVTKLATVENVDIRALEYNFEFAVEDDDYREKSQFLKGLPRGILKTGIKMDLAFENETETKRFYDGATGTSPQDVVTPFQIDTTMTGLEIASPYNYELKITNPKCVWITKKASVDVRKKIIKNLEARPIYDVTQASATMIELTNRETAY